MYRRKYSWIIDNVLEWRWENGENMKVRDNSKREWESETKWHIDLSYSQTLHFDACVCVWVWVCVCERQTIISYLRCFLKLRYYQDFPSALTNSLHSIPSFLRRISTTLNAFCGGENHHLCIIFVFLVQTFNIKSYEDENCNLMYNTAP